MRKYVDKPFRDVADLEDLISAYRLFLGRNPERSEFEHYKKLIKQGISVERLSAAFTSSGEYKQKREENERIQAVDCGGYYVCVKKGEQDFGHKIVIHKTWEPHIVNVLSKLLKEGDTFVDIGANVGVMTFLAAKTVGVSGKVIAVEPNPDNLSVGEKFTYTLLG